MKNFTWDNSKYEKFLHERNMPIKDLISRIYSICDRAGDISNVLDLGCGGGNSTELLAKAFSKAHIMGIDSSANMLEKAKSRNIKSATFIESNLDLGLDSKYRAELIFANASLHWITNQGKILHEIATILKNNDSDIKIFAMQIFLYHYHYFLV